MWQAEKQTVSAAEKIVPALKPIINDISFMRKDLDSVKTFSLGPAVVFQREASFLFSFRHSSPRENIALQQRVLKSKNQTGLVGASWDC